MIKEKPQLVKGFTAATLKGWAYAAANPEEAARITVKYGVKLTYSHELAMMKESIPLLQPDKQPIGSMDPAVWSGMQTSLVKGGFMRKPIDLSKAYTTKFLAP
jgi:ABC-type nitrate/sulfonate/bicarbonate transport system substrate-binding protein